MNANPLLAELNRLESLTPAELATLASQVAQRAAVGRPPLDLPVDRLVSLAKRDTLPADTRLQTLRILAASRSESSLRALAELLVESPPLDSRQAALVFGPLFQSKNYRPDGLFPRLFDALRHPTLAPYVLDLANFVTRELLVPRHPGRERAAELAALLGEIANRLARMEEHPDEAAESAPQLQARIAEGVGLAVSLCDALALIGEPTTVGKLYQALDLSHRRLRTEAAAALARFREKAGEEALLALAAEPVARLRVLAYADELGLLDRIDESYRSDVARAESELALWLAEPSQLGLPPTRFELLDRRELAWPGYDEPVECFLFRFTYDLAQGSYSNLGIAGPLAHAFGADLGDLSPEDIYAAFAGWHALHEEISETDVSELNEYQGVDVERLARRLRDAGQTAIEPLQLGQFFGEKVLIARSLRDGVRGLAVADANDVFWYPTATSRRPLGPAEVYSIYKGRKLLRAFNE